jgi:hypothetical protein
MTEAGLQPLPAAVHPFLDFNDVPDVSTPRRDKDEVRARLLDQLESVLIYLIPGREGKAGWERQTSTGAGNQRSRPESFPDRDGNGPSPGETGRSRLPGGLSLKRG